jgi:hypothetical protein
MFKYFKTIKELKKLRRVPVRTDFLLSLRERFVETDCKTSIKSPLVFSYLKYSFAFAMVLIFIASTMSAAYASEMSLPGDTLYPVKILKEDIQEKLIFGREAKIYFQTERIETRFREMSRLLEKGKNGVTLSRLEAKIDEQFAALFETELADLEKLVLPDF